MATRTAKRPQTCRNCRYLGAFPGRSDGRERHIARLFGGAQSRLKVGCALAEGDGLVCIKDLREQLGDPPGVASVNAELKILERAGLLERAWPGCAASTGCVRRPGCGATWPANAIGERARVRSHASGNLPSASSCRSHRASSRSVLARRLRPHNARVSTGSARCATAPADTSASHTNSQPVHASTATSIRRPAKRPVHRVTAAGVASIRPRITSPESVSSASKVICARCTSNPATIAIRASSTAPATCHHARVSRAERRRPEFMPSFHECRSGTAFDRASPSACSSSGARTSSAATLASARRGKAGAASSCLPRRCRSGATGGARRAVRGRQD